MRELKRCQCGGTPVYRPGRSRVKGRAGRPRSQKGAERLECPACGNRTAERCGRQALADEWNSAGWCGQAAGAAEEVVPYGQEWRRAMLRMNKPVIVALYADACREKEALRGTVRRLQAELNRTELNEVVARLEQRGLIMRGKTETGSSKVINCGSALVGKAVEA